MTYSPLTQSEVGEIRSWVNKEGTVHLWGQRADGKTETSGHLTDGRGSGAQCPPNGFLNGCVTKWLLWKNLSWFREGRGPHGELPWGLPKILGRDLCQQGIFVMWPHFISKLVRQEELNTWAVITCGKWEHILILRICLMDSATSWNGWDSVTVNLK